MFFLNKNSFLKRKSVFMQKKNAFSTKSAVTAILALVFVVIIGLSSAIIFSNNQNTGATQGVNEAYSDNWLSDIEEPTEVDSEGYYIIATPQQLAYISKGGYWGAKIRLYADIDLSEHNWVPIISFAGTFDGQGHKISNMYVATDDKLNRTDAKFRGLFSFLSGATVKNIAFQNCKVYSSYHGGILAGYTAERTDETTKITSYPKISNITIANSSVEVAYENTWENIYGGGLCGGLVSSTVERCFINDTSVRVYSDKSQNTNKLYVHCGGIAGKSTNSTITVSCHTGTSSLDAANYYNNNYACETYCGGIAGVQAGGTIDQCYNTSPVYGSAKAYGTNESPSSYVGGIVGYASGTRITNCYNKGSIDGFATEETKNGITTEIIPNSTASNDGTSWLTMADSGSEWLTYANENETRSGKYGISHGQANFPGNNGYDFPHISTVKTTGRRCYQGGLVGCAYSTSISKCYNTGSIVSPQGYIDNEVKLNFRIGNRTSHLYDYRIIITLKYRQRYLCGNIAGHLVQSDYSSVYYYSALGTKDLDFPTINQRYYYAKTPTYANANAEERKLLANLYSWYNNTAEIENNLNDIEYYYLKSPWFFMKHGSYYTYFTINASNINKIIFNARAYYLYNGIKDNKKGKLVTYSTFVTGIPYTNNNNTINLDYIGETNISLDELGKSVWGSSSYINGGKPYLKAFYWQESQ